MNKIQHSLQGNTSSRKLSYLCCVIILVFCIAATVFLVTRHQSRLNLTQEHLTNLALVHHENLLLQMSNIESIARATVDEARTHPNTPDRLQGYVTEVAQQLPQLRTIVVTDSSGIIIADARPNAPALGIDISDRTYFRVHTQEQTNNFYIDDPVLSRVDAIWSLPITLGIWDNDDTFLGIVIASLDPIYFSSSIGTFADQEITGYLVKENGIILTSLPYVHDQIGTQLPYDNLALTTNNSESTSTENTLLRYHHIDAYNLAIVFRQPRANLIQSLIRDSLATISLIIFLSIAIFLAFRQQIQQTQRTEKSENELRTLTDNISDFVIRFNENLQHVYVNPALTTSTGLSSEEYIGKTNRDLNMSEGMVSFWDHQIKLATVHRTNERVEQSRISD